MQENVVILLLVDYLFLLNHSANLVTFADICVKVAAAGVAVWMLLLLVLLVAQLFVLLPATIFTRALLNRLLLPLPHPLPHFLHFFLLHFFCFVFGTLVRERKFSRYFSYAVALLHEILFTFFSRV